MNIKEMTATKITRALRKPSKGGPSTLHSDRRRRKWWWAQETTRWRWSTKSNLLLMKTIRNRIKEIRVILPIGGLIRLEVLAKRAAGSRVRRVLRRILVRGLLVNSWARMEKRKACRGASRSPGGARLFIRNGKTRAWLGLNRPSLNPLQHFWDEEIPQLETWQSLVKKAKEPKALALLWGRYLIL